MINKDNLIFALFGILIGFISGYLMHEVIAAHQPPRLTLELRAQIGSPDPNAVPAPAPGPADAGMPQGAAPAGGGGPAMEEIQQLRAQVEQNPNDADAVLKLANLNFDIQNWLRAQELYNHYLTLRPGSPDVLTDLGISFRETQKFDQALEQFQKARKMAPDHWQSYYNEVVVLAFDLKRFDEAGQLLTELQRLQPGNADVAKLADAVTRQRSAA